MSGNERNQELVKFIRAEVKKQTEQQLRLIGNALKKNIDEMAAMELRLSKKINHISNTRDISGSSTNDKEDSSSNRQLIIAEEVGKQVAQIIEDEVAPRIQNLENSNRWLKELTCDGTQLITDYRKRVMGASEQLAIESGEAKDESLRGSLFAFDENY